MGRVTESLLNACHRMNARHPWDHNAHYHRWLLRQLPRRCARALDAGCGTGEFARRLSLRVGEVDAVDTCPESLAVAAQRSRVRYHCGDILDVRLPHETYDVISCLAALHHLPLAAALQRFRALLAPGGTIAVLGLYRPSTLADRLVDLCAVPVNLLSGLLRSTGERPAALSAPARPATMSLPQIRRCAEQYLPGARIRRHLFWRYSLIYRGA